MHAPIPDFTSPRAFGAAIEPPQPASGAFNFEGVQALRAFFRQRCVESDTRFEHFRRIIPASMLCLGIVLALIFCLSEQLHHATLKSFAIALLAAIVTVIAVWSGDEHFHVIHRQYAEAPNREAIEGIYQSEMGMLEPLQPGWHSFELNAKPPTPKRIPVTQAAEEASDSQSLLAMSDAVKILLLSGMGVLMTAVLSSTGHDLQASFSPQPSMQVHFHDDIYDFEGDEIASTAQIGEFYP